MFGYGPAEWSVYFRLTLQHSYSEPGLCCLRAKLSVDAKHGGAPNPFLYLVVLLNTGLHMNEPFCLLMDEKTVFISFIFYCVISLP
jgi:hypothetical protein